MHSFKTTLQLTNMAIGKSPFLEYFHTNSPYKSCKDATVTGWLVDPRDISLNGYFPFLMLVFGCPMAGS